MRKNKTRAEYKQIKILNEFKSPPKKFKKKEILINPPQICPICGNTEIAGNRLLFNKVNWHDIMRFGGGIKNIKVLVCSKHLYEEKINFKFEYLLLSIALLITILSLMFDFVVFGAIISFGIFIYTFYKYAKKEMKMVKIVDYIMFKSYPDYSVISIKREDWAEEFRALNQTKIINRV